MPRVHRMLRWFRKDDDEFVGEVALRGVSVRDLRRWFDRPGDDPMYACYEVTPDHKSAIQPHVDHQIRLDRYAYFVECDAAAVPESVANPG